MCVCVYMCNIYVWLYAIVFLTFNKGSNRLRYRLRYKQTQIRTQIQTNSAWISEFVFSVCLLKAKANCVYAYTRTHKYAIHHYSVYV